MLTKERLEQIKAREQAATAGPWETRVAYMAAGVNDGTWSASHSVPLGRCAFCHHDGTFVRSFVNPQGQTMHMHRFAGNDELDEWHTIYALTGDQIAGSYDYDSGGICSTPADAGFIAHARQDIPDLLAEIERLNGLIKQAEWAGDRGVECGDCPWCGASEMYDKQRHEPDCPAFGSPHGS